MKIMNKITHLIQPITIIVALLLLSGCKPHADAGPNLTAPVGSIVTLDGSASYGVKDKHKGKPKYKKYEIASYQWSELSSYGVTITDADKAIASFTVPDQVDAVIKFKLKVTNYKGKSTIDYVSATITEPENSPPTAVINWEPAGPWQVQLDGSGSHDPDNDIVSYQWEVANPAFRPFVTFSPSTSDISPLVTATSLSFVDIMLTVTDAHGATNKTSIGVKFSPFVNSKTSLATFNFDAEIPPQHYSLYSNNAALSRHVDTHTISSLSSRLNAGQSYIAAFEAQGYSTQLVPLIGNYNKVPMNHDVKMQKTKAFSAAKARYGYLGISADDGTMIQVSNDDLINSVDQGVSLTDVHAYLTTPLSGDEQQRALLASFPKPNQNTVPVVLGAAELAIYANGSEVEMAAGTEIPVTLPLSSSTYPNGTEITDGDTLQVWQFNKNTGQWQPVTTASVYHSSNSKSGKAAEFSLTQTGIFKVTTTTESATVSLTLPNDYADIAVTKTSAIGDFNYQTLHLTSSYQQETVVDLVVPAGIESCIETRFYTVDKTETLWKSFCVTPIEGEVINQ